MNENANELQEQIEQRIDELPQAVRDAILSADLNEKIGSIGTAAQLHIDQIQTLGDNTMLVMLGFMSESEYRNEVTTLVKGDSSTAEKIISEVNSQIFLSIRESMREFSAEQENAAVSISQATPKAPLAEVLPVASAPTSPQAALVSSPTTTTPAPTSVTPTSPKVEVHPADLLLTQKTVVAPTATPAQPAPATAPKPAAQNATPPKPQEYKADPYREPIN